MNVIGEAGGSISLFLWLSMIAETDLNIGMALSITFLPWWVQYVERLSQTSFSFFQSELERPLCTFLSTTQGIFSNMDVVSQFNTFKSIPLSRAYFPRWVCDVALYAAIVHIHQVVLCQSQGQLSPLIQKHPSYLSSRNKECWWFRKEATCFQLELNQTLLFPLGMTLGHAPVLCFDVSWICICLTSWAVCTCKPKRLHSCIALVELETPLTSKNTIFGWLNWMIWWLD